MLRKLIIKILTRLFKHEDIAALVLSIFINYLKTKVDNFMRICWFILHNMLTSGYEKNPKLVTKVFNQICYKGIWLHLTLIKHDVSFNKYPDFDECWYIFIDRFIWFENETAGHYCVKEEIDIIKALKELEMTYAVLANALRSILDGKGRLPRYRLKMIKRIYLRLELTRGLEDFISNVASPNYYRLNIFIVNNTRLLQNHYDYLCRGECSLNDNYFLNTEKNIYELSEDFIVFI